MKRQTRSKTGCSRCKERRVKCDETRPACGQCQRRNVSCPGYRTAVRWSNQYQFLCNRQRGLSDRQHTGDSSEHQRNTPPPDEVTQDAWVPTQRVGPETTRCQVAGPTQQDGIVEDASLDLDDPFHHRHDVLISDLAHSSTQHFDDTLSEWLMTSESDAPGFAAGLFPPIDREFWSGLTLAWSPDALGCAQVPTSLLPAQPEDNQLVNDEPRTNQPERQLQLFELSEVTNEEARVLLQHYFDTILIINSVFDSNDNPLRYLVADYVKSSSLIRNCVLSCSAMHLTSNNQGMHRKVVRYHSEALNCLVTAMNQLETSAPSDEDASASVPGTRVGYADRLQEALLALLLLFSSSSWLDPSDIGLNHLMSARKLFGKWLVIEKSKPRPETVMQDRNRSFIIGAMAYSEATTAFVFDQPMDAVDYLEPFCQPDSDIVYPNPWTGVSTPIFIIIARVGICVRQKRAILNLQSLGWPKHVYKIVLDELLRRVADTEHLAFQYYPPRKDQVVSNQPLTPSEFMELETMACSYKLAALLEIYRSFPQLAQIHNDGAPHLTGRPLSPLSMLSMPASVGGDTVESWQEDRMVSYELAINLLSLLKDTADRRAMSLAHTLALIIGGSALHHPPEEVVSSYNQERQNAGLRTKVNNMLAKLNMRPQVVEGWRSFVRNRLKSNADFVGLESYRRTQTLMENVWSRMDNATEDKSSAAKASNTTQSLKQSFSSKDAIHWLEVMTHGQLETVFG